MWKHLNKWLLLLGTIKVDFFKLLLFFTRQQTNNAKHHVRQVYMVFHPNCSLLFKKINNIALNKRTVKSVLFYTQRHPMDCLWYLLLKGSLWLMLGPDWEKLGSNIGISLMKKK